jgi:hypothetical protein
MSTTAEASAKDTDDNQTREEGEISDSESAAATKSHTSPKKDNQTTSKTIKVGRPSTPTQPAALAQSAFKIKAEPVSPSMPRPRAPSPVPLSSASSSTSARHDLRTSSSPALPIIVDEHHVRPGLTSL